MSIVHAQRSPYHIHFYYVVRFLSVKDKALRESVTLDLMNMEQKDKRLESFPKVHDPGAGGQQKSLIKVHERALSSLLFL